MKNKIFKILPATIAIAILISVIGIFLKYDADNALLKYFLGLDTTLLSLSASLIIYAFLSDEYEGLAKLGTFLCIITIILSLILTIMEINNIIENPYKIISKINSILNSLENCIKYSGILLLIETTNTEANKYRSLAIKAEIMVFIYSIIYSAINQFTDLDYTLISKFSNASSVINGFFYLFTILFLIEKGKEIINKENIINIVDTTTTTPNTNPQLISISPLENNQQNSSSQIIVQPPLNQPQPTNMPNQPITQPIIPNNQQPIINTPQIQNPQPSQDLQQMMMDPNSFNNNNL